MVVAVDPNLFTHSRTAPDRRVSPHPEPPESIRRSLPARGMGYTAFGTPNATSTTVSVEQRYTYTGREKTTDPTLMYYRWRMYGSGIGRFLQRDPIRYSAGINIYGYIYQNPVRLIDPYGLDGIIPTFHDPTSKAGRHEAKAMDALDDGNIKDFNDHMDQAANADTTPGSGVDDYYAEKIAGAAESGDANELNEAIKDYAKHEKRAVFRFQKFAVTCEECLENPQKAEDRCIKEIGAYAAALEAGGVTTTAGEGIIAAASITGGGLLLGTPASPAAGPLLGTGLGLTAKTIKDVVDIIRIAESAEKAKKLYCNCEKIK